MTTRAFLALDLDKPIRDRLLAVRETIDQPGAKISWVAPENLHVTLNFLGDVTDKTLAEVCDRAADVAAGIAPFEFRLRGVRCIPLRSGPVRMLWVDVIYRTGQLKELHEGLDAAFDGLGLKQEERTFRPHITLARVKSAKDYVGLRKAVQPYAEEDFGAQDADELVVYGSQLTSEGPIYTPVARAKLGQ
jgi:2'-5' RNA ligase